MCLMCLVFSCLLKTLIHIDCLSVPCGNWHTADKHLHVLDVAAPVLWRLLSRFGHLAPGLLDQQSGWVEGWQQFALCSSHGGDLQPGRGWPIEPCACLSRSCTAAGQGTLEGACARSDMTGTCTRTCVPPFHQHSPIK